MLKRDAITDICKEYMPKYDQKTFFEVLDKPGNDTFIIKSAFYKQFHDKIK